MNVDELINRSVDRARENGKKWVTLSMEEAQEVRLSHNRLLTAAVLITDLARQGVIKSTVEGDSDTPLAARLLKLRQATLAAMGLPDYLEESDGI